MGRRTRHKDTKRRNARGETLEERRERELDQVRRDVTKGSPSSARINTAYTRIMELTSKVENALRDYPDELPEIGQKHQELLKGDINDLCHRASNRSWLTLDDGINEVAKLVQAAIEKLEGARRRRQEQAESDARKLQVRRIDNSSNIRNQAISRSHLLPDASDTLRHELRQLRRGTLDEDSGRSKAELVKERCDFLLQHPISTRLSEDVQEGLASQKNWAALFGLTAYLNATAARLGLELIPDPSTRIQRNQLYAQIQQSLRARAGRGQITSIRL